MMNRGAEALQAWFGDDYAARESLIACTLSLSTETLDRWRLGEAVPGDDEREWIGRLTDGAVLGAMWDEAVANDNAADPPAGAPADIAAAPLPFYPALLCEISGPLGSLPPGPPFRAIIDPMCPGQFVLAGPGVALVLDETLGWALRDALLMGLQDVRADRVPAEKPRVAQIG